MADTSDTNLVVLYFDGKDQDKAFDRLPPGSFYFRDVDEYGCLCFAILNRGAAGRWLRSVGLFCVDIDYMPYHRSMDTWRWTCKLQAAV